MSENPYASPVQQSETKAPHHSRSGYQYKPLRPLVKILVFSVGLVCFGNFAISAMDTAGVILFPGFSDPNANLSSEFERYFIFAAVGVGLLTIPAFIVSAVFTPMLFYRANANLRALGVRGLQHTPGWCAGYWFIPIILYFKPYQVAAEINEFNGPKGFTRPAPKIGLWWACWITGNILSNIETRLALAGVDLGSGGLILSWVASLLTCAAGFLFIRMIFSFADSQETLLKAG